MKQEDIPDIIASQDVTDEMRIQFTIDKFYENMEGFVADTDHLRKLKLLRNNLVNMTDTYLRKFKNKLIIDSFYEKLKNARNQSVKNGMLNKYHQYMNEIRVIQEFKGIQENISEKLADEFIQVCIETGEDIK